MNQLICPKNLIYHELIGLNLEVIESKNKNIVGTKGKIIDETKNLIIIKKNNEEKKIIKKNSKFKICLEEKDVFIDGGLLVGSPEKRTKKNVQKKRI